MNDEGCKKWLFCSHENIYSPVTSSGSSKSTITDPFTNWPAKYTSSGRSRTTCTFVSGKLRRWGLQQPQGSSMLEQSQPSSRFVTQKCLKPSGASRWEEETALASSLFYLHDLSVISVVENEWSADKAAATGCCYDVIRFVDDVIKNSTASSH